MPPKKKETPLYQEVNSQKDWESLLEQKGLFGKFIFPWRDVSFKHEQIYYFKTKWSVHIVMLRRPSSEWFFKSLKKSRERYVSWL